MSETVKPPERRDSTKRAEKLLWSILGTVVIGLAFGGWGAKTYIIENLASRSAVVIAGTKADFSIDKHMELILAQINQLVSKRNKTQDDRDQLRYLREELQRMREMRRGK